MRLLFYEFEMELPTRLFWDEEYLWVELRDCLGLDFPVLEKSLLTLLLLFLLEAVQDE